MDMSPSKWDSASRTQKEELCRRSFGSDAVQEMEVWPSDVGLRGQASNHPVLRWLKTVVVSDREKVRLIASGGDQEDVPEAPERGNPGGRRC